MVERLDRRKEVVNLNISLSKAGHLILIPVRRLSIMLRLLGNR